MPKSLAERRQYDENPPDHKFRNGAGQTGYASHKGTAMMYVIGGEGNQSHRKEQLLLFFRHLDNGVRIAAPKANHAPLGLAGLEPLQGLYCEANQDNFSIKLACLPVAQLPVYGSGPQFLKGEFYESEH